MLLCVSFNLTNQVWNYFEFCAKHILCLRIIREIGWKSKFGKTGFKTCVLEKHFISYSCIFISYIKFFEVYFQKSGYFSEKMFFPDFQLIQSIFWSIEILFKIFSEPSPGSIDRTYFSINRTSWIKFFKNSVLTCSNIFSKLFYTFFSHSPTRQGSTKIFLLFSSKILTKFLSP